MRNLKSLLSCVCVLLLPAVSVGDVVFTEIHYNADPATAGGEFIEIANNGPTSVDIGNWVVDEAVSFAFPSGTTLAAGEYIVLANNSATAASYYGVDICGEYIGRLSNAGETILLKDANLAVVDVVTFDDDAPWPTEADGGGPSLELRDVELDNNVMASWWVGQPHSPGAPNDSTQPGWVGAVVITEIMYKPRREERRVKFDRVNAGSYDEQGDDAYGEYVEITNVTGSTINLLGWTLTDGVEFEFGNVFIAPGEHLVIAGDPDTLKLRTGVDALGPFTGSLDDGGERLTVIDDDDELVDTVFYDDRYPWPISPDQLGTSLEVIFPLADNGVGFNWRASEQSLPAVSGSPPVAGTFGKGTPAEVNSVDADGLPPFVDLVSHLPEQPTSSQDVQIVAHVSAQSTVVLVEVEYFLDNSTSGSTVLMFDDGAHGDGDSGDGAYGAVIPRQSSPTFVRYRVRAIDAAGRETVFPYDDEPSEELAYFHFNNNISSNVPLYFLYLTNANLSTLTRDPYNDRYVSAHLAIEGVAYPNIEVRLRGRGSRTNAKRQWKFRFNRHQLHEGNRVIDTMFNLPYTQWFAFQMYEQAGIANLGHDLIRVYKNGDFFGVYIAFDSPNSSWVRKDGYDQSTEVYKARSVETSSESKNSDLYTNQLRTDRDFWGAWNKKLRALEPPDHIRELTDAVNRMSDADLLPWIDENINHDEWFERWILNILMVVDDFAGHNFYAFRPGGGKWSILGYDYDSLARGGTLRHFYTDGTSGSPAWQRNKFHNRVSRNSTLRRIWALKLRQILLDYWHINDVFRFIDQNHDRFAAERNLDRANWSGQFWRTSQGTTKSRMDGQRRSLTTWLSRQGLPGGSAVPAITPDGGMSEGPVQISMSVLSGWAAVYTIDGSDPRLSTSAEVYEAPFLLRESATVRAAGLELDAGEVDFGTGDWTDLAAATFEIGSGTFCTCDADVAAVFSSRKVFAGSAPFSEAIGVSDFNASDRCGAEEDCSADGTLRVVGAPGQVVERRIFANIVSQIEDDQDQVAGWSLSIAFDGDGSGGATLTGATTAGTAGCDSDGCPGVGLVDGGFAQTQVIDPARNDGQQGAVSVVVITFNQEIITLPGGQSTVLDLTFEVTIPATDTEVPVASFSLVDGLRGAGNPVNNIATVGNNGLRYANAHSVRANIVAAAGDLAPFIRSDFNGNGDVEPLTDSVFLLRYLFREPNAVPPCLAACDMNLDGRLQINDPISLLIWGFRGGDDPPEPFPTCAASGLSSDIELGCVEGCP